MAARSFPTECDPPPVSHSLHRGGWPILGPALKLAEGAPWDTMTRWAQEYGSIYKFSLFGNVNVVISDPAFMKEVMRSKVS